MMRPLTTFFLLAALAGAAACLTMRGIHHVNARMSAEGEASATLNLAGQNRVAIQAGRQTPTWGAILFDNKGTSRIDQIRLWGVGPVNLISPTTGEFSPFALLPGERFLCRQAVPSARTSSGLEGSFLWQMPVDPRAAQASIQKLVHARVEPGRGLVLKPAGAEAWVQLSFNAPFDLMAARVGWQVQPPKTITAMVSVDGRAWGGIGGAAGDPWLKPLDLSSAIKDRRVFSIRLLAEPGPAEIVISQIRVEREIAAIGQLQPWRPGQNEATISFDAPKGALMDFKLLKTE